MLMAGAAGASSAARVRTRLDELVAVGPGPGANRPGLSAQEEDACRLVARWMADAGLAVERDTVGNVVGRLPGREPALGEVWSGSHVDTVPAGGRYDGALGVVAAIEAVERIAARPERPRRTLAAVAFRDEEGWRFGTGLFGSRALAGLLRPGDLAARDRDGVSVREALAALGRPVAAAPPASLPEQGVAAYVELHIEQGPVLAAAAAPLGVVSAIVGMAGYRVTFAGAAGHAGTTPMGARADALCAAAAFVLAVRAMASALDGAVGTVGRVDTEPGAANVIPERAHATVDVRAGDPATLDRLCTAVERAAADVAAAEGCTVDVRPLGRLAPVAMAPALRDALHRAAAAVGAPAPAIASGAGHDAQALAAAGVPVGMLFARSLNGGVSHRPDEHTDENAIALATAALERALADLAGRDDRDLEAER
jgi:allantoate deiminase